MCCLMSPSYKGRLALPIKVERFFSFLFHYSKQHVLYLVLSQNKYLKIILAMEPPDRDALRRRSSYSWTRLHRAAAICVSLHGSWGWLWPWEFYMRCYPKHSSIHNECVQQVLLLMCVDDPSTLFVVAVFRSLMRFDVFVVGFFLMWESANSVFNLVLFGSCVCPSVWRRLRKWWCVTDMSARLSGVVPWGKKTLKRSLWRWKLVFWQRQNLFIILFLLHYVVRLQ